MCLAVPGQIMSIYGELPLRRMGKLNFSGVTREVNLSYVPDAKVGDFVVVHVGFALSIIDKAEADKLIECIAEVEDLGRK